jgi:phosphinothricin acetyltransferase
MKIIPCDESYSDQILAIMNEVIVNTTIIYDYAPRGNDYIRSWFGEKKMKNYPVIGAVDDEGKMLGFATYGSFRSRPAYKYTVEHSLYVHQDHRRMGLGKILLHEIIQTATRQEYHNLVAGIDSSNVESIQLHKSFGFEFCGRIRQAGFKFAKWLDLEFYQLILSTPARPVEE